MVDANFNNIQTYVQNDTLESVIHPVVRFSEVDSLGIVWHGNYVTYFEDGREHFGKKYGISYEDIRKYGYLVPITNIEINYKNYIRHEDELALYASYVPSKKAEINFNYKIVNTKTKKVMATGKTTQVFIKSSDYKLVFAKPEFFKEFEKNYVK